MRTEYSETNAAFSNAAHMCARKKIYPMIFNCNPDMLSYEDTLLDYNDRGAVLDGEMATDRIVHVKVNMFRHPIIFTIQERFRRIYASKYQDITITEWNNSSNLPSELYKLTANIFLYGYFDDRSCKFADAILFDVPMTLYRLTTKGLSFGRGHNQKNQDFITIKFSSLHEAGSVLWHLKHDAKTT